MRRQRGMKTPNQHWIPKFLLKSFADSDGKVFQFSIQTDQVSKVAPRSAASSAGFNDFEIEGKAVSFEARLEKIETRSAPVLKRIVDTRSLASLTSRDRKKVSDFIAAQSFRTEAFFKGLEYDLPREKFGEQFKKIWDGAFILSGQIELRHWVLMVIEGEEVFYLGDHPVVLQRTRNPKDGSDLGFDVTGIEAFIPLSPKCALYMPCRSVSDEVIAAYKAAVDLHRIARESIMRGVSSGGLGLLMSQEVIRKSYNLYRALTTGDPLRAEKEHVENLNALQCGWARTTVYSNRSEFGFARYVFENTPQYRQPPRTRLLSMTGLVPDSQETPAEGW